MEYLFFSMLGLLATATWFDFKVQKIPNWLTFGGAMLGALINAALVTRDFSVFGIETGSVVWSLLGIVVGLTLFLPIYAYGKMGAGDVKLLGMVGSFLGPYGVFWAGLYSIIAGGIVAIFWIAYQIGLQSLFNKLIGRPVIASANKVSGETDEPLNLAGALKSKMPYGLAIAIGAVISYFYF